MLEYSHVDGQNSLNQPSHSGSRVQMTKVTLDGPQGNACGLEAGLAIYLIQRRNLNRISDLSGAAVSLRYTQCSRIPLPPLQAP